LNLSRDLNIELSYLWKRYMAAVGNNIENAYISEGGPLTGVLETAEYRSQLKLHMKP